MDSRANVATRYVLFTVVALALHFTIALILTPAVFSGGLTEPDGYMRLVRVQQLWDTGAWFDGTIPRSNAPFGETLHWTRPFDVWLLLGAVPLSLIMPFRDALHAWAVVSTPLLLVATSILAVWAVRPLVASSARYMVMIALLVQPAVMSYALPGRADHHVLVFAAFVVFVGALFRAVSGDRAIRYERYAGLALAFATWLTVESLVVWAGMLLALAVLWVVHGGDLADRARTLMAALALGTAVAVLVEVGPSGFSSLAYDRISVVHLAVALVGVAAWGSVGLVSSRAGSGGSALRRGGLVLGAGAVAAGVLALALPGFFAGPWADLSALEREYWVTVTNELQPVVPVPGRFGVFVAYLGPAFVCVPFVLWRLARDATTWARAPWVVMGSLLLLYLPLGMSSLRFTPFPEILFAMIITVILAEAGRSLVRRDAPRTALAVRAGLTTTLLGGFIVLGGLLSPDPPVSAAGPPAPCLVSGLVGELDAEDPQTILAHPDFGPEILYFTPHQVLGTVYHRNIEAVRLTRTILTSSDADESLRLLRSRRVDLILICPDQKGGYFGREAPDGGKTLYARLVEGRAPAWLERRSLAAEGTGGFLLYSVER